MLRSILGGCGTGKSTRLMEELRTRLTDGRQVLVIVPEQFSFEAEKKLYAFLGAELFNRLHTYSFVTLSHEILRRCGSPARNSSYASEQEKLLCLYQAVQECAARRELRLMERRAQAQDFILNVYGIIIKLRKAGVTAETLGTASVLFPDSLGDKTHDISRILLAYDRILQEHGRYDSLTDLTEAAGLAEMQYFFEHTDVCIDEFDSFTGDQYKMLEVILRQADSVTAAIRADDPSGRESGIFRGGNHTYHELSRIAKDLSLPAETEYCRDYLRSVHPDLIAVGSGALRQDAVPYTGHVRILEAEDPVMEAEYIGAEICRILQEDPSLRCADIAIAVKEPEVYFPLLERALDRYALPYDLSTERSVLHTGLIRYFLSLLSLLTATHWQTEELLRYSKTPLSGCPADTVAMLEHFCFTWSIDREDWSKPFWSAEDETLAGRAEPFGGERLEALRIALTGEITSLRRRCKGETVRGICAVLYQHLVEKRDAAREVIAAWEDVQQKEFVMLWNLLMDVLDTMADSFGDQVTEPAVLRQSILLLLQSCAFSTPPQTLDSIRIVDAQTARLDSPKIVFVPGVRESVFPGEVKSGGMFSEQELRRLEEQHIKLSRLLPELHSDELLIVRKTLAAPSERLYLTYPLRDAAFAPAEPAGVLLRIEHLFKDESVLQSGRALPVSFYIRTMKSAYFHYVRRFREDTGELAALRTLLEQDPVYAARLRKLVSAAPDPDIRPATMEALLGAQLILSPSGIERFYNCAFQYFCQYVLRLFVPERNALTARSGGDYVHYCLEQLLRSMDITRFLSLTRDELRQEIERLSGVFSVRYFSDAVRRDGRFQFNYRKAGQSLIQLIEHMQKELREGQFTPVGFEVRIGGSSESSLPPLSLRDGSILCQGGIDRVDICDTPDGRLLRVVDYKTGTKTLSPEKLADGLDMQMLIYLFTLRQNGAYGDATPSGVFYMPSGQPRRSIYETRSEKAAGKEALLEQFYRMKGLVLDTTADWMEPEIRAASTPVIGSRDRDTLFSVDAAQMAHLQTHVEQKILTMADTLRSGRISPAPDLYQEYTPCGSCAFADICGKAQNNVKKRTDAEKQEALRMVFGTDTAGKEDA